MIGSGETSPAGTTLHGRSPPPASHCKFPWFAPEVIFALAQDTISRNMHLRVLGVAEVEANRGFSKKDAVPDDNSRTSDLKSVQVTSPVFPKRNSCTI